MNSNGENEEKTTNKSSQRVKFIVEKAEDNLSSAYQKTDLNNNKTNNNLRDEIVWEFDEGK